MRCSILVQVLHSNTGSEGLFNWGPGAGRTSTG